MDNLCHTLVGAAIGEAGLKSRTRFGSATLMIAANLPDLDILVLTTGTPSVAFRRGWTHGLLAQALLPIVLTVAVLAFHRLWSRRRGDGPPPRAGAVLGLSFVGVLSHVGLDWLNNYGIRLLMPFSGRWFYGDAVFILDPWLWLILGAGVFLARRRGTLRPAQVCLLTAAVYIAGMIHSTRVARERVLEAWTAEGGAPPVDVMVGPAPVDPLRKAVIVDLGDHYRTGGFSWWSGHSRFDAARVDRREHDPAVRQARADERIGAVLTWARFPYYEVAPAPGGIRVTLRDVRFGARVGSVTVLVPE
jgi:inner membrane protein